MSFSKAVFKKLMVFTCVFTLAMSMMVSNAQVVLNAQDAAIVKNIINTNDIKTLGGNDPTSGAERKFNVFQMNGNTFTFDADNMKYVSKKEKERGLEILIGELNTNTAISKEGRNYVFNEIRENADKDTLALAIPLIFNDTQANIFSALNLVEPFKSPFTTVLGVVVVLLVAGIVCVTVLDLAYIGIPVFRTFTDGKAESSGQQKAKWVSHAAYSTVQTCETESRDGYKEPYFMYLKRRAVTLLVLALCIMYLLLGAIAPLMGWLLELVGGFTQSI